MSLSLLYVSESMSSKELTVYCDTMFFSQMNNARDILKIFCIKKFSNDYNNKYLFITITAFMHYCIYVAEGYIRPRNLYS